MEPVEIDPRSIFRPEGNLAGETQMSGSDYSALIEELKQLRACMSIYRFLLDRLLEKLPA